MSHPLFSICTPVYNCAEYLPALFDSLKSQYFSSWELILVDDASTDDFSEFIQKQKIIPNDCYSIITNGVNLGPYESRKKAIELAKGDYILCIDADDAFASFEVLSALAEVVLSSRPDVILFNMTRDLDTKESCIDYSNLLEYESGYVSSKDIESLFINSYSLNNLATKAIKRGLFRHSNSIKLLINEDRYEFLSIMQEASSFYLINRPFYYYRLNPDSTTEKSLSMELFHQIEHVEEAVNAFAIRSGMAISGEALEFLKSTDCVLRSIAGSSSGFLKTKMACKEVYDSNFFHRMIDDGACKALPLTARLPLWLIAGNHHLLATWVYKCRKLICDIAGRVL